MKIKLVVSSAVLFLSINIMMAQTKAGNDKDEHGCRASAGYTFSVIKNECIRVFEQEVKLDEVNPGTSSSIAAVIFSDDKTKAEVFIPSIRGGVILLRTGNEGNYGWKKGKISLLDKGKEGYILLKKKKIIYKSPLITGG
ncbi:MAG TPA: hypothetical protein PLL00_07960 [Bacteroidia bacterium]|jgi:hypothetical protein|nr:hypothetical protein [Bacteroidia bacterium]